MAPRYEVELRGFDEQIRRLEREDEIARRHLSRAMSDSVRGVERLTRANAPVVSGALRAGVDHEVLIQPGEGIMGRVLDRTWYAIPVEFGARPHTPPGDSIAANYGAAPSDGFLISRSIKDKGTKGRFFMYRAFKSFERAILTYFERALDRIRDDLGSGGR
jgi:hypothetical protein